MAVGLSKGLWDSKTIEQKIESLRRGIIYLFILTVGGLLIVGAATW